MEPTEDITTDLVKENPFRYAGYYFDRKTQYYYLQARYYDPRPARFISEDTYEGEVDSPLTLNLYTYVQNSPMVYIDPTGHYCVSLDGNWAQAGTCKSPSSIYMGPDSAYIGKPIISGGTVLGRLKSGNKIEWEPNHYKGNYWKSFGLETGFLGAWYANSRTVIQVLEFMKADILRNGSIDTHKYVNSGSVYIQAVVVAISTGKGRDYGNEVISGIEYIQAKYELVDRKKGVVDLDTINALIDNYKKKPEWLHNFNGAAYELDWNFGEEFYQAVVFGIAGVSASKGTGNGTGAGNALVKDTGSISKNIENLRAWAKKNGWVQQNSSGGVEQWGVRNADGTFSWRLKLKPESSTREGLGEASNQPRFDARLDDKGTYYNPFTGQTGGKNVGTHIPLGK